jgi:CRP-like cAMP-binding protein
VLALTPASLLVTTPAAVKSFSHDHPHAYVDLIEALARELAMQQVRLERGASQPIVSNLALLLLMLSARFSESERLDVVPKALTARRWLATFLGVSNESVERAVRTLRAEGLISTADGELRILNRAFLQQEANVDASTLALLAAW